jgi:hypothetical protein
VSGAITVVAIVLSVALVRLDGERRLAESERDVAAAELADLDRRRAVADGTAAGTDQAVTHAHDAADAALAELTRRTADRDALIADVLAVADQTGRTRILADVASLAEQDQARRLAAVDACLAGMRGARERIEQGRSGEALDVMHQAQPACQASSAALAGDDAPAFPYDFADPSVLWADGRYYAYATNGGGGAVQTISSPDLVTWSWVGTALTGLPRWAAPHYTWAPAVLGRGGTYFLYYTARDRATRRQCVSSAWSLSPAGPFVDDSSGPLVCQHEHGGSIDPSPFVAPDGTVQLLWKSEDETVGGRARLWSAPLGADLRSLAWIPAELAQVDRAWEGRTIEAPSMVEVDGRFVLLYSGNRWDTADYAVGYAVCDTPAGPCAKPADNVVLAGQDRVAGPGGAEVLTAPDGSRFVSFHAWTAPDIGFPDKRQLHVEQLRFDDQGRPSIGG